MDTTRTQRAIILTLLALAIAVTRLHHFAAIPDASWAVFFVGGFYLREWTRWAFPALMALALVVDYLAISAQGISFWQHYCVSPAYWCLLPAYFAMWAGGLLLRRAYNGTTWRTLGLLLVALVASVAVCHLVAQGSFYWLSDSVSNATAAGWWKNYTDWLAPYLRSNVMYVGAVAVAHVVATRVAAHQAGARHHDGR